MHRIFFAVVAVVQPEHSWYSDHEAYEHIPSVVFRFYAIGIPTASAVNTSRAAEASRLLYAAYEKDRMVGMAKDGKRFPTCANIIAQALPR